MNDIVNTIAAAWAVTTSLEIISVIFGLIYVYLAARENIWCWPAALIGTGTAIYLFWDASLIMESALNVYYLAMAFFGWWQWQYGSSNKNELPISSWRPQHHIIALVIIASLTIIFGYVLSSKTSAALPYVDSFTTWAAVVTTWMVARKVLENWLYWMVINPVSVWLFAERGLYLYALLFIAYSIIPIFGYIKWRRNFANQ